mmetsp:Transcript_59033/g.140991  ORF Transcript_59033/g.140991 Transcript_59033/m.140991 type:complete len:321 (+) Transcript_59033:74-1036(+)
MSRHSKHSNDRSFYTYKERVDAGFSISKKDVLGTDAFLPFGHCCLSLRPPKDAVATPDGHIYDKATILESLLQQRLDAQAENAKFEEQERKKAKVQARERLAAERKELEEFQNMDSGLSCPDARHKRSVETAGLKAGEAESPEKRLRQGELLQIDKSKQREKSFWAKECTPTAAQTEVKKVEVASKCPMTGKKLRVKDLIPVKFEIADEKMYEAGGGKGVFCCAVSKHPITHQQAYLIKPSGQVVLETVLKDIVMKEMRCPVTGVKLKGEQDWMKLQMGGTGFAAHNEVEAKSSSLLRSAAMDNRLPGKHLPGAGWTGLR